MHQTQCAINGASSVLDCWQKILDTCKISSKYCILMRRSTFCLEDCSKCNMLPWCYPNRKRGKDHVLKNRFSSFRLLINKFWTHAKQALKYCLLTWRNTVYLAQCFKCNVLLCVLVPGNLCWCVLQKVRPAWFVHKKSRKSLHDLWQCCIDFACTQVSSSYASCGRTFFYS